MVQTTVNNQINVASTKKYNLSDNNLLGLWIYLMGDCILFATIFSVYCVLSHGVCLQKNLFNLKFVLLETILLLCSSITYGMLSIYAQYKKIFFVYFFLILTFILGCFFILLELYEFNNLIQYGYTPQKNSFFSAFFTLIGMHGIHVIFGLLWLLSILFQVFKLQLNQIIYNRILCLGLFWHFLDIIWVCVFTVVYLIGDIQ